MPRPRIAAPPALFVLIILLVGFGGALPLVDVQARYDIALEPGPIAFRAEVTAYSSSPDETWGDPFITASGRPVGDGVIACPRRYPFGTQFRIGSDTYTCWDRLHPKYDHRFDIWKSSKEEALQFGRRHLTVEPL